MNKKHFFSMRIDPSTSSLLAGLSEVMDRSQASVVRTLVRESAKEFGLVNPAEPVHSTEVNRQHCSEEADNAGDEQ